MTLEHLQKHRCRIRFENVSRTHIPEEYHYEFRNLVLKIIDLVDHQTSKLLHDDWKTLLVFSGFLGKQWNTDMGLVFRNVDVVFASPSAGIISAIMRGFFMHPNFELCGATIKTISINSEKIVIPEGVTLQHYETLGEIVIKKGERSDVTLHVGAEDNMQEYLLKTIARQFSSASGFEPKITISITSAKQKKKAIIKGDKISNSFIGLRLGFDVTADSVVHEFLLTQGIGHHRKLGFGMVGIARGDSFGS